MYNNLFHGSQAVVYGYAKTTLEIWQQQPHRITPIEITTLCAWILMFSLNILMFPQGKKFKICKLQLCIIPSGHLFAFKIYILVLPIM